MPRLLLACLLMLSACAAKDPEGTLNFQVNAEYDPNTTSIWFPELHSGDNTPMRLPAGDLLFVLDSQEGQDYAPDCLVRVDLVEYGKNNPRLIYEGEMPGFDKVGINGLAGGVYFARVAFNERYCAPAMFVTQAPWPKS